MDNTDEEREEELRKGYGDREKNGTDGKAKEKKRG